MVLVHRQVLCFIQTHRILDDYLRLQPGLGDNLLHLYLYTNTQEAIDSLVKGNRILWCIPKHVISFQIAVMVN